MKKTIDEKGNVILTAEEGKVLRRKGTDEVFGNELHLGYSHYIGGVLLDTPHKDVPEEFEEVEYNGFEKYE